MYPYTTLNSAPHNVQTSAQTHTRTLSNGQEVLLTIEEFLRVLSRITFYIELRSSYSDYPTLPVPRCTLILKLEGDHVS